MESKKWIVTIIKKKNIQDYRNSFVISETEETIEILWCKTNYTSEAEKEAERMLNCNDVINTRIYLATTKFIKEF